MSLLCLLSQIAEATRVAEANEGQTATLQAVRRWLDSAMARTVAECARLGSFRAELLRVLHERGGQLPLSTLKDAVRRPPWTKPERH